MLTITSLTSVLCENAIPLDTVVTDGNHLDLQWWLFGAFDVCPKVTERQGKWRERLACAPALWLHFFSWVLEYSE